MGSRRRGHGDCSTHVEAGGSILDKPMYTRQNLRLSARTSCSLSASECVGRRSSRSRCLQTGT